MDMAQNSTGGVTQVLVHVSTYQGSILVPDFEPKPYVANGGNQAFTGVQFRVFSIRGTQMRSPGRPRFTFTLSAKCLTRTDSRAFVGVGVLHFTETFDMRPMFCFSSSSRPASITEM